MAVTYGKSWEDSLFPTLPRQVRGLGRLYAWKVLFALGEELLAAGRRDRDLSVKVPRPLRLSNT